MKTLQRSFCQSRACAILFFVARSSCAGAGCCLPGSSRPLPAPSCVDLPVGASSQKNSLITAFSSQAQALLLQPLTTSSLCFVAAPGTKPESSPKAASCPLPEAAPQPQWSPKSSFSLLLLETFEFCCFLGPEIGRNCIFHERQKRGKSVVKRAGCPELLCFEFSSEGKDLKTGGVRTCLHPTAWRLCLVFT